MSGHSKWHNIRVRKTAADAARGKIYTRHARLIEMATRAGSNGDPATNASLRVAIDNAKADNVPNANIERAIKKGLGALKGEQMSEVVYAAYGPGGCAFLIECITDNRNRTLSNVKNVVTKHGGNWAESSAVLWMFERKGVVVASKAETAKALEEMELELIDFGAEEMEASGATLSVTTDAHNWSQIRDFLKGNGWSVEAAGLKYLPTQKQAVADAQTARKVVEFIALIDEDEDVTDVHTNAEMTAEAAAALG